VVFPSDNPRDSALPKSRQSADWLACEAAADVYVGGRGFGISCP
jgi:hypothetical protein